MSEEEEVQACSMEEWAKFAERELRNIKKLKTTDRLSLLSKILYMNDTLLSSLENWETWMSNALIMSQYTEEELQQLSLMYEKVFLFKLQLDVKFIKSLLERMQCTDKEKRDYIA